ncbi:MAG: histidine kinase [Lachnospiraceae bacterium]|nr:histidine kinase [Lachnospiraceae bacterium]
MQNLPMQITERIKKISGFFARIWRRTSIKLAIIFILTQLPLYYSGIQIYNWGVNVIRNDVISRDLESLNYYLDDLEKMVDRVKYLQTTFLGSREINVYANRYPGMNIYDQSVYLNRIRESLLSINNSSRFLDNVIAYIPKLQMTIEASGRHSLMSEKDLEIALAQNFTNPSGMQIHGSTLFLNMPYPPFYSHYLETPFYAVTAFFSLSELSRTLMPLKLDDSFLCLFDDDGMILAAVGEPPVPIANILLSADVASGHLILNNDGERYLAIHAHSPYFGYRLMHIVSEDLIFDDIRDYQHRIWIFSLIAGIIVVIFLYAMVRSINKLIKESYEQKLMLKNSELNQLQAQINPHFIYNSYYLLHRLIKGEDKEKAMNFSRQMGVYFKYIVGNVGTMAPLHREIEHARIYALIQAERFEGRIEVSFEDTPAGFDKVETPRLILQPVLENAFEHGFADTLENGFLIVKFVVSESSVLIMVDDNGERLSDDDIDDLNLMIRTGDLNREDKVGLMNINRRLKITFGEGGYLKLKRSYLGGLCVEIRLERVKV